MAFNVDAVTASTGTYVSFGNGSGYGAADQGETITVTTTESTASSFGANAEVFVSGATGGYMVVNSISSETVDGVTTYTIVLENKTEGTEVALVTGTS
ncbi:MAG: hypothetical protein VYC10_07600, partial [Pseudomonadota bacterium]|nr:hypothetical protein [Pseudomonadota bacterium]